MTNLYCIAGLGADERLFSRLELGNARLIPLPWAEVRAGETLESYAEAMASRIDRSSPLALLGVSFGGIVAQEMTRLLRPRQTFLVSSVRERAELPWYGRAIGTLGLDRLFPVWLAKKSAPLFFGMMGAESEEDRSLLRGLVESANDGLLKWSTREALTWDGESFGESVIHIHGTADKILPIKYVNADIAVRGGGHFMIYNHALEIGKLIDENLCAI